MKLSRRRFAKRRSRRKTSFPVVAVVQKKMKHVSGRNVADFSQNNSPQLFGEKSERIKSQATALSSNSSRDKKQQPKVIKASIKKSRATIDYKNVVLLRKLITAEGKILPRRINKLTAKQQRHTQRAIKTARVVGLLPFINKTRPLI